MSENLNNLFKSFVNDIIKIFPEYENRLNKYYDNILSFDNNKNDSIDFKDDKLDDFLSNIDAISSHILDNDSTVFQDDPIILQNVSFKMMWNSKDTNVKTKNSIWKYLKSFCIHSINNKQTDTKIKEVKNNILNNEKIKDKETFRNMKKLKKLTDSLNKDLIDENPKLNGMDEMGEIFENTSIGKIAKELTEELNIEEMIDPANGDVSLDQIFNGGNLMNIMKSIGSKVNDIDMSGGNIMQEAMDITNSMQGNPLFSSLMSDIGKNENNHNPSHNPSQTKKRLQQKLQDKQKNVVDDE